jgi:exportin-1
VFKVGLDYWNRFVPDIYTSVQQASIHVPNPLFAGRSTSPSQHPRLMLYDSTLKGLRKLMVERMVKPEEVLITTDEHGNVVRDFVKDTDVQQQYKTMRETLVYLSHLDHADTEKQMLDKLRMQLNGEEWQWERLNTLCWVRSRLLRVLLGCHKHGDVAAARRRVFEIRHPQLR